MAEDDIVQKIKIETEGGDKAADQYKAVAKAAEEAAGQITKAGEGGGKGFDSAAKAARDAAEVIGKIGDAAQDAGRKFAEIKGDSFHQLQESINKLGDTAKETFAAATDAAQKFGDAGTHIEKLGDAIAKFATSSGDGGKAFAELGEAVQKSQASMGEAAQAAEKANEGFSKIGTATTEAVTKVQQLGETLGKAKDGLENVASTQVGDKLSAIGEAGGKAADGITKTTDAAQKVGDALGRASTACENCASGFQKVGDVSQRAADGFNKTVDAASRASVELNKTTESVKNLTQAHEHLTLEQIKTAAEIAKIGLEIGKTGVEIYEATQKHKNFLEVVVEFIPKLALLKLGWSLLGETLVGFIGTLGLVTIAVGTFAAAIGGALVVMELATKAAIAMADPYVKLADHFETLAAKSKITFQQLQIGEQAFRQMGVSAETFGGIALKIQQIMATMNVASEMAKSTSAIKSALEAEKKLLEAQILRGRSGETLRQAAFRLLEVNKQLEKSTADQNKLEQDSAAARRATAAAIANELGPVIEKIKAISDGMKDVKFDALTTGETKAKALAAAVKQAADAGKSPIEQFKLIANAIHNIPSLKDALALGKEFGISEVQVDRIRRTGTELNTINDIFKRLQASGGVIGEKAADSFDKMHTATVRLNGAWERLQQAWDSSIFARFAADFSTKMIDMKRSVVEWAAESLESFNAFVGRVGTAIGTIPDIVYQMLANAKKFWFEAWSSMAEGASKLLGVLGRTETSQKLHAMAEDFQKTADAWGKAADAAGERVTDAWRKPTETIKKTGDAATQAGQTGAKGMQTLTDASQKGGPVVDDLKKKVVDLEAQLKKLAEAKADPFKGVKGPEWDKVINDAKTAVDKINTALKIDPKAVTMDFSGAVKSAEQASTQIKKLLDDIKPAKPVEPPKPPAPPPTATYQEFLNVVTKVQEQIQRADQALTTFSTVSRASGAAELTASFLKITELLPQLDKLGAAFKDVPEARNKIRQLKDAIWELKDEATEADLFAPVKQDAEEAAAEVKKAFGDIKDEIKPVEWSDVGKGAPDAAQDIKKEFTKSFDDLVKDARNTVKDIETEFKAINISGMDFSSALDFEAIIGEAEDAAESIEDAFGDIDISDAVEPPDWDEISDAASAAASQITQSFGSIDLSSLETSIEQIKTSFQAIGTEGILNLVMTVQQAFQALSQQAQFVAQGISASFGAIDFSGLISQIQNVTSAFQAMEAAANAAAAAAANAAAAASSAASSGAPLARGGLFRGRPGIDTNLAWLTDMEFVMRPEAVAKYGVSFMNMINSLSFPGFRNGGLFNPRAIMIPAFRSGGVNSSGGGGRGAGAQSNNMRPLNITIGSATFGGLLAPEDTAKAMVRASVGKQLSATGIRPRWNK